MITRVRRIRKLLVTLLVIAMSVPQSLNMVLADEVPEVIKEDTVAVEDDMETATPLSGKELIQGLSWEHSILGPSATKKKNSIEGSLKTDDTIRLTSLDNGGKVVTNNGALDGLNAYTAPISASMNFIFKATAHINEWSYTGAQDGFGIAAFDKSVQVGLPENTEQPGIYNNAVFAGGGRVTYHYEEGSVSNSSEADTIDMWDGVRGIVKSGLTKEIVEQLENPETNAAAKDSYKVTTDTLESSCGQFGTGKYNLLENYVLTHKAGAMVETDDTIKRITINNPWSEVKLEIQKNNTGFFLICNDKYGRTMKTYDTEMLSQLDEDNIYIGFFTARNADITFSDIELTLIDPEEDAPKEEKETVEYELDGGFESAPNSNSSKYDVRFRANWDGDVKIYQEDKLIYENSIKADELVVVENCHLNTGGNHFYADFKPSRSYHPQGQEGHVLKSYDEVTVFYVVNHVEYGKKGNYIYVSPDGSVSGNGRKENPLTLEYALKYAQRGQVILLKGGEYNITENLRVRTGINGTKNAPIYLMTDPESIAVDGKATLRFINNKANPVGFTLRGDYWHIKDIDIVYSLGKALSIYGSNTTIEDVGFFNNYQSITVNKGPVSIRNCSFSNQGVKFDDTVTRAINFADCDGKGVVDGAMIVSDFDRGISIAEGEIEVKNSIITGNTNGIVISQEKPDSKCRISNTICAFNDRGLNFVKDSVDTELKNTVLFNNVEFNILTSKTGTNRKIATDKVISYKNAEKYTVYNKDVVANSNADRVPDAAGAEIYNDSTVLFDSFENGAATAGEQKKAFKEEYFKSVTFSDMIFERNADGTINNGDFLVPIDNIGDYLPGFAGFGTVIGGTPSETAEDVLKNAEETDGRIDGNEEEGGNGKFMTVITRENAKELIAAMQAKRKGARGTKNAPEKVEVPQAYEDTTYVEEWFVNGKVKTREIQVARPGKGVEVTVNAGVKYQLDDFGSLVKIDCPISNAVKVDKKGVVSLKADSSGEYEASVSYNSLSENGVVNSVKMKVKVLKAKKGCAVSLSSDSIDVEPSTVAGSDSGILSAKWSIKGAVLEPGVPFEIKKKVKNEEKVLAVVTLEEDNSKINVTGGDAELKGSIKVVCEINGKKITTPVKVTAPSK